MMKQKWYIFLVLWLSFTLPSFAAPAATKVNDTTSNTVSTSTIQQAIDDLPAKNLPENEAAVAKSALDQALQFAKNRDESESKIASLKTQLAEAPAKSCTVFSVAACLRVLIIFCNWTFSCSNLLICSVSKLRKLVEYSCNTLLPASS